MSKKQHKTSIGGQAVYEGVMMKGPKQTAIALRLPDGSIDTTVSETKSIKQPSPSSNCPSCAAWPALSNR